MTDKEQIICHGVDVSKCDRLNLNSAYGWDDPDMCSITCCKNGPNCLFKQLARKTQECRELEIKNVTLQNRYQQVAGATTEAACYRKALEEIEGLVSKVDGADECSYGDFNCSDCDDDCTCPTKVKRLILDIINKARGE